MPDLSSPVVSAGGIYKRYANSLKKLGIDKFSDFLYHIPFRYEDYSIVSNVGNLQEGETVTIRGNISDLKNQYTRRFRTLQKAKIADKTGAIDVIWFNQPFLLKTFKTGDSISISGKVERQVNDFILKSPDYEMDGEELIHTGRLVPIYPETRGVSSRWIRRQVFFLLKENKAVKDFLPEKIKKENELLSLADSLQTIHFPKNLNDVGSAKKRLSFDELFLLQLSALERKKEWAKNLKGIKFDVKSYKEKIEQFISSLPFELTSAQKKALQEILDDLSKNKPMNRLLEGDVGSGKTVVATVAMYLAFLNGLKSIIMAPTEILANQHYQTLSTLLSKFGVKVDLQTANKKLSEKASFDILVGTHAVLFGKRSFKKVGLVVIDEQQRFGVEQRSLLRAKGQNPHVLTMTATPIPRTVALALYGDLDLSLLDEMPKGRKVVKTWLVPAIKREGAYTWIEKQIKENKSQAFIICPFIEESESMVSVKAATKEFERLRKEVFPNLTLGLLHGRMKTKEKDDVLHKFQKGILDILVSTPVVEVGIDIPGASIIVIEAADRFGLAQLHQLRGRVGRRGQDAYCLLFSENQTSGARLKYMEQTNIGSVLAEYDLKIRGAGEIYGTAQHGMKFLKIASFSDLDLIKKTKDAAEEIVDNLTDYPILKQKVSEINTASVSPD